MPELRKDPVVGRWVVVSTERVRRPTDFPRRAEPPPAGPCAFCPGREHETPPEVLAYRDAPGAPDGPGWRVRVVPNKFPALRIEGELERRGRGIYDLMNGIGASEVVVDSPDHALDLDRLPVEAVAAVLAAYRDRIADLRRDERFRYVIVFKNHGAEAGATLSHPHSQLFATPVVPLTVADELHNARAYHGYKERCLFCDILRQELEERVRIVAEGEQVVAFAPFAARFPFETWLLPRRHAAGFERIQPHELADLAAVLRTVLRRLVQALGEQPYNFWLHSAPFDGTESPSYHWHFEVIPRLSRGAGLEWGSGMHVNPVPPEDAARILRDARD
ncbi:MAG TPA: galactose-1-phosphate uridylyltransferase [Candidatus Binatia bacterium]|nr:galactose-1-phosphate uridylyltransferase [Candidatus Binatia bacterium]